MLLLELSYKVNADVDAMGFKIDKVQSAAIILCVNLPSEIHELR